VADDADAVILLPLTTFLTADSYAAVNSTAVPITGTLGTIKLILMKYLTILLSIFLLSCSSPSIIDYKPEKFKFKSDKPFVFRKDKNLYFSKGNFDSLSNKPIYTLDNTPSYYEENIFISPNSNYLLIKETDQLVLLDIHGKPIDKIEKTKKNSFGDFERNRYRWEKIQWSKDSKFILLIKDLRKEKGEIINLLSIYDINTRKIISLVETPNIVNSRFSNNSRSIYYSYFKTPNLLVVNKVDIDNPKKIIEFPEFPKDSIFICFLKYEMGNRSYDRKVWIGDKWELGYNHKDIKDGVYIYHEDTLKLIMRCIPIEASSSRQLLSNHENSLSYFLPGNKYYKFKNYSKEYNGSLLLNTKTMKYQEIGEDVEFYFSITSQDIAIDKHEPNLSGMSPDEFHFKTIKY